MNKKAKLVMKKEISKEFLDLYNNRVDTLRSELSQLKELLNLRLLQLKRIEGTRARVVDARVKRPAKIWKKAVEFNYSGSEALKKISDIIGVRIVCNNLSDTKSVLKMIERESGSIQIKKTVDMVTNPREDGYRAIHLRTIINRFFDYNKIPCEIQIRTLAQDMWGRLSRDDLYGNNPPELISAVSKAISNQLSAIDELAQQIRDELNRPAEQAQDIKETDPLSPQRLALLFKQKYNDDIWQWSLYDWISNLEEAEAETIRDVRELLDDENLREQLNKIIEDIRGYPLENSEWVVFSAMVAAEVNTEAGIESVKDRIEKEYDEITTITLRESLPPTIEDFIDELEYVTSIRTKDSEDQAEEIKCYFLLLECISEDMYGMKDLDTICAVEALSAYYGGYNDEDRLTKLIDRFVQAYL
jgi:ppGpp synthetase/RelA/SpoT-type nucleotidyltranferase